MIVELIDETHVVPKDHQALVSDMIVFAANYLNYPQNRECAVTFVSSEQIQAINRDFRGIDSVTDVISFALNDHEEDVASLLAIEKTDEHFVTTIGDIVISVERAQEQALEYGHSLERELGFLAVHGFLHLNGYDHQTPEQEKEMFELQESILVAYGLERA